MMRYSQQQLDAINQQYSRIKKDMKLAKLRSSGIQNVLIDGQIEAELLDKRNSQDISNDKYARQSLLNDYSNDLIKSGDAYSFQRKIVVEGLDEFFINNYPKIKSESKNFRITSPQLMFDLVRRLFNKAEEELDINKKTKTDEQRYNNVLTLLEDFKRYLKSLTTATTLKNHKMYYEEGLQKLDAVIQSMNFVNNKIQFLENVFGEAYPVIKEKITEITEAQKQVDNNQVPVLNEITQEMIDTITEEVIQQAMDESLEEERIKPRFKSNNQQLKKAVGLEALNTDLTTYTEEDYEKLEIYANENNVSVEEYSQFLNDLTLGNKRYNAFNNKTRMLKKFMEDKDAIIDTINAGKIQNKKLEKEMKENKSKEDKRKIEAEIRALENKIETETEKLEKHEFFTDLSEYLQENVLPKYTKTEFKTIMQSKLRELKNSIYRGEFMDINGKSSGGEIYGVLTEKVRQAKISTRNKNKLENNIAVYVSKINALKAQM